MSPNVEVKGQPISYPGRPRLHRKRPCAILGKILDRIVKAQEDSRQKDIDHIWTKLLERLVKAQEDAAKPSNPWNTNSIPTFALSAATFVIGILTFINSKEWLVKIPYVRRFFLLFWNDTPGLEEKVKALESMVGQATHQAIPAAQQSNQLQPAPQPTLMERVNTLSTDVHTLQTDASRLTPRVDAAITQLSQIFDATSARPAGMVVDLTNAIAALDNRLNKVHDTNGATPAGLVVELSAAITDLVGRINAATTQLNQIYNDTGAAPVGALATAQRDITILRGLLDQISVVNGGQMTGRLPDVERNITAIKRDLEVLRDKFNNYKLRLASLSYISLT